MFITDEKCENAVLPCVLLRFTTMCQATEITEFGFEKGLCANQPCFLPT